MKAWRRVVWWMTRGVRRSRAEAEVDDDIRTHVELDAERLRSEGYSKAEAHRLALDRFGDLARMRGEMLEEVPTPGGESGRARHAAVQGARSILRAPAATILAILTLGAAASLVTVTVSVAQAALWADAGVDAPDRVVLFHSFYESLPEGMREQPLHSLMLDAIRSMDAVQAVAAFKTVHFNLTGHGDPHLLDGLLTSPGLFRIAGTQPMLGPGFGDDPDAKVVVLSWDLWHGVFGGDPGVLGSSVVLDEEPYEVVGVMPDGFVFPRGEDVPSTFRFASRPDLWIPFEPPAQGPSDLAVVARLAPDVPFGAAEGQLAGAEDQIRMRFGSAFALRARPLRDDGSGGVRPALTMVGTATALVVLIALGNMLGLGVVRSQTRAREFAVRSALGARRIDNLAVLCGEAVVVAAASTLVGVGLGALLLEGVRALAPEGLPGLLEASVAGFPALAAAATGIVGGLGTVVVPAVRSTAPGAGGRVLAGSRTTSGRWARPTSRAIVAAELGMTLVLVSAAFVLYASVSNLLDVDLGFRPEGVLTIGLNLPEPSYPDADRMRAVQGGGVPDQAAVPSFHRRLLDGLRARPGVAAAGSGMPIPFGGTQEASVYWIEGMADPVDMPLAEYTVVSDGYMEALGLDLLEGRTFRDTDRHDTELVAVVSEGLAKRFPEGLVVGSRIKLGGAAEAPYPWLTVVGVVADVRRTDLAGRPRAEMYVPMTQGGYTPQGVTTVLVRARPGTDPLSLVPTVRDVVGALDPKLPVERIRTMDDLVAAAADRTRFVARLVLAFATVALLTTLLGLYSVVSYAVAARQRELAIRSALGASPADVARSVTSDAAVAAAWGALLACMGLWMSQSILRSLVFGVAPLEPGAVGGAGVLVAVALMLAVAGPVRRARTLELIRLLARE